MSILSRKGLHKEKDVINYKCMKNKYYFTNFSNSIFGEVSLKMRFRGEYLWQEVNFQKNLEWV